MPKTRFDHICGDDAPPPVEKGVYNTAPVWPKEDRYAALTRIREARLAQCRKRGCVGCPTCRAIERVFEADRQDERKKAREAEDQACMEELRILFQDRWPDPIELMAQVLAFMKDARVAGVNLPNLIRQLKATKGV
jgi:hypothetical protein